MANLWERFENIVNVEDVIDIKSQMTPIQSGDYQAILESIEPSESKTGLPMIKGKFRLIENNRVVFYNQLLQNLNNPRLTALNIADAIEFVEGLLDDTVEFKGLAQLAETISTIPLGGVYLINVSYKKNDYEMKFPKLKIISKLANNIDEFNNTNEYPF